VSTQITIAVTREARDARVGRAIDEDGIRCTVAEAQWERYGPAENQEMSKGAAGSRRGRTAGAPGATRRSCGLDSVRGGVLAGNRPHPNLPLE